jgi:hypothetical protein
MGKGRHGTIESSPTIFAVSWRRHPFLWRIICVIGFGEANSHDGKGEQTMYAPLATVSVIIATAIFLLLALALDTYRRYRKRKVIICPENQNFAEVNIKAGRAGLMTAFGRSKLSVGWCSRWPQKRGCAEGCVKENWPMP